MELRAARFCRGSGAAHNEQVMPRCARSAPVARARTDFNALPVRCGAGMENRLSLKEKVKNYPPSNVTAAKTTQNGSSGAGGCLGAGL